MQRGGAELRTLALMRHLAPQGFEFHYGVTTGLPGELDTEIESLGGKVHPIRLGPAFPLRFFRTVRAEHIDIVHSHIYLSSGPVLALAHAARVSGRIAHFRSTGDGRPDSVRRRVQRRVFHHMIDRHATVILAVGEGAMAHGWGAQWRQDARCRVIYNGLNLEPYTAAVDCAAVRASLGAPADCVLVCHVGRLDRAKNQVRLISIFAEVVKRHSRAFLVMVGRGTDETEDLVRQKVHQLGVDNQIRLVGQRDDVARILRCSDIMVYPSQREGLPGVPLEAAAAGLRVIASDLPGILELARHFPTIETLPLAAADADWADRIDAALAEPRDCSEWNPRAVFAETPFCLETSAAQYAQVYEAAMGR